MNGIRERIYVTLQSRIISKELAPGSRLREQELAKEFSASRTPVREALLDLERDGLVNTIDRAGTFVAKVSFQDLKEAFEVRLALMPLVARLLLEHANPELIDALARIRTEMEAATSSESLTGMDSRFHDLVNDAIGHRLLKEVLSKARWTIERGCTYPDAITSGFADDVTAVMEALQDRSLDRLEKLLYSHAKRYVEDLFI